MSIEDLLAPLPEKTRLGGPGPFVINLSASSAPIDLPPKGFVDCQRGVHVYQVQRMEDRRPRYRLRVGPFASEDDADAVLLKVRDLYPSALTATADADDLRAIAGLQAKSPTPTSPPLASEKPADRLAEKQILAEKSPARPALQAAVKLVVPTLVEVVDKPAIAAVARPVAAEVAKPTLAAAVKPAVAEAAKPVITAAVKAVV
ncbi:MAG: SPOR domain-containing protein, partial [Steroidobacteraceae bacterium]